MPPPYDLEFRGLRRRDEAQKPDEFRTPGQRDRDRILHSSAFRRLAGVTQVVSADEESHLLHNRLTHSVKVAQVARRIAEKVCKLQPQAALEVGGVDPDTVEAAALAHDLGHPPFGHVGEKELDDKAKKYMSDAFEGNAQSFRIVTKISIRSVETLGLNLSRATLNALLKYPWPRGSGGTKLEKKWSVYQTEMEEFHFAREGWPAHDVRKCAEAEIMDWADDIAYSVHDVEDFYRMRLIPLDRLATDEQERRQFFDSVHARHKSKGIKTGFTPKQLEEAFENVLGAFPAAPYDVSRFSRALLRSFSSQLIGKYVSALELHVPANEEEEFVVIAEDARKEVAMLKELTWHYVIHNPALATQQAGHRKIMGELFDRLFESAADADGNLNIFPPVFREALGQERKAKSEGPPTDLKAGIARIILDVISSFTEQQALRMYGRLNGTNPGSILDPLYY